MKITLDEYKELYKGKSGIYSRENYIKDKYPEIHSLIIQNTINVPFNERIYMFVNEIKKRPSCLNCNKEVKFKSKTIGYQKFCSNSCSTIYSKEILNKNILDKYGVVHPSLIPHNIKRRIEKKIQFIKDLIDNEGKFLEFDSKTGIVTIDCFNCNKKHYTSYSVLRQRNYLKLSWQDCITSSFKTSSLENDLRNYIQSLYDDVIIFNCKTLLPSGKEIDIYIPDIKIGFEFNGLWWHNEINKPKYYHYNKWLECKKLGVNLIQIYEDDWLYKNDIVKSRIDNIFKKTKRKIYSRKCIIKEIHDVKIKNDFLNKNHLQGNINSSHNIGLYYKNELISMMCFDLQEDRKYRLLRFCNKLNTSVIGSASKLFKYFISKYDPKLILTESLNEWVGDVYFKLNMNLSEVKKENFWYIDNNLRKKEKSNNIKIWGAGVKIFQWNR